MWILQQLYGPYDIGNRVVPVSGFFPPEIPPRLQIALSDGDISEFKNEKGYYRWISESYIHEPPTNSPLWDGVSDFAWDKSLENLVDRLNQYSFFENNDISKYRLYNQEDFTIIPCSVL